jgi:hypothetical protein
MIVTSDQQIYAMLILHALPISHRAELVRQPNVLRAQLLHQNAEVHIRSEPDNESRQ